MSKTIYARASGNGERQKLMQLRLRQLMQLRQRTTLLIHSATSYHEKFLIAPNGRQMVQPENCFFSSSKTRRSDWEPPSPRQSTLLCIIVPRGDALTHNTDSCHCRCCCCCSCCCCSSCSSCVAWCCVVARAAAAAVAAADAAAVDAAAAAAALAAAIRFSSSRSLAAVSCCIEMRRILLVSTCSSSNSASCFSINCTLSPKRSSLLHIVVNQPNAVATIIAHTVANQSSAELTILPTSAYGLMVADAAGLEQKIAI
jgi:hypothetical protein